MTMTVAKASSENVPLNIVPLNAAPFTITLFGPMSVLVEGRPLPHMHSRKALWLLALLALRPGRSVEREWLAGTLWPDADKEQASASLRPVLSELRKALGGEAVRVQSPSRNSLLLDLTGAEVDVSAFDAAVTSQKLPALERAAALYLGPLLEGCAEEWVPQERAVREQDFLRTLQTLAETALRAGDPERAAGYHRRAISLDPWREASQRGLMEALSRGGDSNRALQAYREFVELLRADPRAAPDEETNALYARLRSEAKQQAAKSAQNGFAPIEAAAPAVCGHLTYPVTALIGREDERLEVAARLKRSRLVTLTGPGGIGKTRLAVEVASEVVTGFADGVWLVALDSLSDRKMLSRQIATLLGLKEEPGRTCLETVADHLRTKRLLLVLDNCEHLLEESAQVAGYLLRECAGVRILATSREALGITGETSWVVPSLSVPDPAHLPTGQATLLRVLMSYEGVQLFVERAQAVRAAFSLKADNAHLVAQVCCRLEGIPLAIEMAAARVGSLTVEQIAARLDDHLGLLTGGSRGGQSRQQTLRATMDWSYALLSEPERLLLGRLSVFAGGWSLEAAERVCREEGARAGQVLDLLASLVDKSLAVFQTEEGRGAGGRYRLQEAVRQYAAEHLAAGGEAEHVRARHQAHFLALAEEAEPGLRGHERGQWLRGLEAEHDNLRAALRWDEEDAQGAEAGLRLAGALWRFWYARGDYSEGLAHLHRALARQGAQGVTAARGRALNGAGNLTYTQGGRASAQALHEESLCIRRDLGDRRGSAVSLNNLGLLAQSRGDHAAAQALFEESLSHHRDAGDLQGAALTLSNLGSVVRQRGDYASARALLEEGLGLHRDLGDRRGTAWSLSTLGLLAYGRGDYASARALHEEGLTLFGEMEERMGSAWSLNRLGILAQDQGDVASARALFDESLSSFREAGDREAAAAGLRELGVIMVAQGKAERAAHLGGAAQSLRESVGARLAPDVEEKVKRVVSQMRLALGEDAFAAAWGEGRALTWEEKAAYALEAEVTLSLVPGLVQ